jgi:PAS domain S-box-containing protein
VAFPIVFASDGFLQATGYAREDVIGKSPRMLHGPMSDQSTIDKVWECISSGTEGHFEIVNHRKDGSHFTKELHLSPVRNFEGETAFIFATQIELEPLAPGFNPTQWVGRSVSAGDLNAEKEKEGADFQREKAFCPPCCPRSPVVLPGSMLVWPPVTS